jgi:hypothetical protein
MANSKTHAIAEKHRRRQRAAKAKLHLYLAGKTSGDDLSELAKRYLTRHLRVAKKG